MWVVFNVRVTVAVRCPNTRMPVKPPDRTGTESSSADFVHFENSSNPRSIQLTKRSIEGKLPGCLLVHDAFSLAIHRNVSAPKAAHSIGLAVGFHSHRYPKKPPMRENQAASRSAAPSIKLDEAWTGERGSTEQLRHGLKQVRLCFRGQARCVFQALALTPTWKAPAFLIRRVC